MEQTVLFKKITVALFVPISIISPFKWLCLMLILTACTTAPVRMDAGYSRTASQFLYTLEPWSLQGRLALTGAEDSWQADINWEHQHEAEKIKLSGPLGQGGVAIHLTKDFVTVARGNNAVETSDQPEQFINRQLGLFVPVRSLRYWVVGLPMPDRSFEDRAGGFKQEGWQIDYPQMQTVYGKLMPRKVIVTNEQVKLKLFIDQWILSGNESQ